MNLVWWLILPIIYILTWITSWRPSTAIEIFLFSLVFIIPLLISFFSEDQNVKTSKAKLILFYDRVIETGLLLLCSVVPWILDTRANDAIFIKTVYLQIIAFTIGLVWFLRMLEEGSFKMLKLPLVFAVLAWWWWAIVTFVTSSYKYASIELLYRFISYFLIFFVVLNNVKKREQVWRIITTFMVTTAILAIYGIFQHFGYDFVSWGSQSRIPSSLGNPDFYSGYLCLTIPLSAGLIFATRSMFNRTAYGFLTLVQLLALYYTLTRGGWAAVPLALLFFLFLKFYTIGPKTFFANKKYMRLTLIVIAVLVGAVTFVMLYPPFAATKDRMLTTVSFGSELAKESREFLTHEAPYPQFVPAEWIQDGGNKELMEKARTYRSLIKGTAGVRVTIWTGAYRMFLESPFTRIFGQGMGAFRQNFARHRPPYYRFKTVSHNTEHAHSEYFEILADEGAVGIILFILIVIIFFKNRLKPLHTPDHWKQNLLYGLLAGIFGYLFENLGSVNFRWTSSAPFFWFLLALTIVVERLPDRPDLNGMKLIIDPSKKQSEQKKPKPQVQQQKQIQEKRIEFPPELKVLVYICVFVVLIFLTKQILNRFFSDINLRNGVLCRDSADQWELAESYYKKALKTEPTNIEVPYKLAYIYAQKKEWEKALTTYYDIIRLAPDYTQIHYNLGITYYNLGRIDLALPEFERTVKLDWSNDVGFFMLGVCYSATKEWEKSIWAFKCAIAARKAGHEHVDPAQYAEYYPAAHFNLANVYYQTGNLPEAAANYETVLRLEPGNPDALSRLQMLRAGVPMR